MEVKYWLFIILLAALITNPNLALELVDCSLFCLIAHGVWNDKSKDKRYMD